MPFRTGPAHGIATVVLVEELALLGHTLGAADGMLNVLVANFGDEPGFEP